MPSDPARAEGELRVMLQRANALGLPISIGGARHSMGGQSIAPGGITVDMLPFNHLHLDEESGILHVGAGARWSAVVPFLDAYGYSVAVMQSNNDFSVGGSISVNCHGWQHNKAPIASTVNAFRIMLADGRVLQCSRLENAELFALALGGYGLFGIILDVELKVVPNESYRQSSKVVPSGDYAEHFSSAVGENVGMAYGRLCVVPGAKTFLRNSILNVYERVPGVVPELKVPNPSRMRRAVFRAQEGSKVGKRLRWALEKRDSKGANDAVSRNQLLNDSSSVFQERGTRRTDILHESFIPHERLEDFLTRVRVIIPKHRPELLNVTIRNVTEDHDTFLRYADQPMFALVMLFNIERAVEADVEMQAMTRELIDAALECGGRYYLPYRLHASVAQFHRAYPQAATFFERKRFYDPEERFVNEFYLKYAREAVNEH